MMMAIPFFFPAISAFLLLIILVKYWKIKCKPSTPKLPPGPPKLPLIGNLHQLTGPLPHHTLANLAMKHGPIMHLQMGEHLTVVVSSSEIAKEVLKIKEAGFAERPQVLAFEITSYDNSGIISATYGDYWRQIRKICVLDLLSVKQVKSFRSIREEEVWDLVETISCHQGSVVNLSLMLFSLTNNVTSRAAFGSKCQDQRELRLVLQEAIAIGSGFHLADLYPSIKLLRHITGLQHKLERIRHKLSKILDDVIQEHSRSTRRGELSGEEESSPQDILGVLLKLRESNDGLHLTDNQIKAITTEIFGAGSDTAATTMEWAMSELLRNPKVMEKTQVEVREAFKGKTRIEEADVENLNYLKLVIKETLRLHPPAVLLGREAMEKCEINGYEIPVKTRMIINVWALGRDPNNWSEPDVFRPERFLSSCVDFKGTDYEFLPFGAGRRMCPGISFATANIELALSQLLYHFDWRLADDEIKHQEFDMSEAFGITVRRKHNLNLIPIIRVPLKN